MLANLSFVKMGNVCMEPLGTVRGLCLWDDNGFDSAHVVDICAVRSRESDVLMLCRHAYMFFDEVGGIDVER